MRVNWNIEKIEDVCEVLDSKRVPLNSEQRFEIPGNVPYYGANGVQGYISEYIFDEDLILMAEDGGNFEQYSIRPIAYKIKGKSWVNNHAHILKAKEGYSQDYIFYSVVHKNIISYIKGGTRSKLNLSDLKDIDLAVPSLPQQKKIAQILSTCDTVLEQTEAAIAKYQALKQGMLHDLFTRGIDVNTGQLRPSYKEAPELYKETELGFVPKEWEVEKIEEFASQEQYAIVDGPFGSNLKTIHYRKKGVPIIQSGFVTSNDFIADKYLYVDRSKYLQEIRSAVKAGDLVMAKIGAKCGTCALLPPNHINGILAGNSLKITVDKNNVKEFLLYFLHLANLKGSLSLITSTTAQPAISMASLKKMIISRPEKIEQEEITRRLKSIDKKIQAEQQTLAKYTQLKAGLMQDLLSGKVGVESLLPFGK